MVFYGNFISSSEHTGSNNKADNAAEQVSFSLVCEFPWSGAWLKGSCFCLAPRIFFSEVTVIWVSFSTSFVQVTCLVESLYNCYFSLFSVFQLWGFTEVFQISIWEFQSTFLIGVAIEPSLLIEILHLAYKTNKCLLSNIFNSISVSNVSENIRDKSEGKD